MAINLKNPQSRARLQKAIKRSWEMGASERMRRADLISIYADRPKLADLLLDDKEKTAYLNLFALFVRGHEISLAYRAPRWSVNARRVEGKGFDKMAQNFLDQYAAILNFANLVQLWAVDTAFGRAVGKVCNSIAPKGITSPTAPRCYRLNPDHFIPDRSAPSHDEWLYAADIYFADHEEAKAHEHFHPERRANLSAWTNSGSATRTSFMDAGNDHELFASDQTRLIDVYIPTLGVIATWPCSSDSFSEIADHEPLQVIDTPANPYPVVDLLTTPDSLDVISRLGQLRPLNMLANDLYTKGAIQAKQSQRNPVYELGDELDAGTVLSKPDGEAAGLNNTKALDVFVLPGPDQSVLAMAANAASQFGEQAGNLNTQLGISAGAPTARQTQALIGQISQAQAVDRMKFERFLGEVGKRLLTLAFHDEALELSYAVQMPGSKIWMNAGWGQKFLQGRMGRIEDFAVETVAFSTAFRGPQERLAQMQQASTMVFGAMQQAAMGAPINIEAVISDAAEAFDLVPNLAEWWSGQPPTPTQKTGQVYQTMAGPSQGSDVNYNGVGSGGSSDNSGFAPQPAGLASSGSMV